MPPDAAVIGPLWQSCSFVALQYLGIYWGNNGQRAAQGLNRYAAIDPMRTFLFVAFDIVPSAAASSKIADLAGAADID